ncbi:MAG TPA: dihydrolipoamide acetyltransferase family protein [Phnomibacter sp.]|nr:dihydrolipoamide acetyltransferase family protein [Phnomibacter sp.]
MSVVDLVLPKLGESIMEATILKWLKKPGDKVAQDEAVLEIATDKVDSEVPSTAAGVITEVLFPENAVVPIGSVIARIQTEGGAAVAAPAAAASTAPVAAPATAPAAPVVEEVPYQPTTQPEAMRPAAAVQAGSPRFYSPLVLKIAQEEGISMAELETIPGTGMEGRVSKKDMMEYLQHRGKGVVPQPAAQPTAAPSSVAMTVQPAKAPEAVSQSPVTYSGNVEIVEMDRMRKVIAKHMVDSKATSAHVTSFAECDVTNLVLWRDKVKKEFEKREGTKITFTPLFIEAIVKCIKKYPWLNSSVDGDKIIVKKDINLGMATALPSGNLIVPVIKGADQLNLVGLAKQVNNLADAARNGKLKPDDTMGGTFTMTNVGSFGSIMGTPIINQPQVAIMAVGAIKKRPVVIETAQGDSIAIRHMMYISLSYDHRIIDGALGSTFLNAVARELEAFDINRNF